MRLQNRIIGGAQRKARRLGDRVKGPALQQVDATVERRIVSYEACEHLLQQVMTECRDRFLFRVSRPHRCSEQRCHRHCPGNWNEELPSRDFRFSLIQTASLKLHNVLLCFQSGKCEMQQVRTRLQTCSVRQQERALAQPAGHGPFPEVRRLATQENAGHKKVARPSAVVLLTQNRLQRGIVTQKIHIHGAVLQINP